MRHARTRHGASVRSYTRRRFRCRSMPLQWRHLRITVQRRWSPKEDGRYDSTSFYDLSIPPRRRFLRAQDHWRQVRRGGRRSYPCLRAVDCASVRSNGNDIWQLAFRRKVAGDVRIIRSMIADVGKTLMWIKHENLFAKLTPNQVKRSNEIRIPEKSVVKVPRINIDIRFHFCKMLRPRPFRIGASPRIGRASRSDINPFTGSACSLTNHRTQRNGECEQR